jgi:hypothetical protein
MDDREALLRELAQAKAELAQAKAQMTELHLETPIRREAESEVNPATLSVSAQKKLEIALRQHQRKLDAEHAARTREVDEQVRLRVIAENKDYLAMVKEMEAEARSQQKLWREMIDNHKPLFTVDQFKTILMCLHPDGLRTADKLANAFRLFNDKKLQLTAKR